MDSTRRTRLLIGAGALLTLLAVVVVVRLLTDRDAPVAAPGAGTTTGTDGGTTGGTDTGSTKGKGGGKGAGKKR